MSVFAQKVGIVQVVAANSSAFSREATYLLALAFRLSECFSRDGREELQQRAVMDKPLVGSGCVERSNSICSMRALRCRLETRRLTFPFPQFRRTDYELPRELCHASHS
jgi:hypothetical protein